MGVGGEGEMNCMWLSRKPSAASVESMRRIRMMLCVLMATHRATS